MIQRPAGYRFNSDLKRTESVIESASPEVYTHDILYFFDEYLESNELDIKKDNLKDIFPDIMFYIHDRIKPINNDDIDTLDHIFNIYLRLCSKCNVLPTLYTFSFLTGISTHTFNQWKVNIDDNGVYINNNSNSSSGYRNKLNDTHGIIIKKWYDICKSGVINKLHNQNGTNANLIFIAKAGYGMRETAPIPAAQDTRQTLTAADLPVLDCSVDDQDEKNIEELTDDS